ncbi:MAG TPA: LLM class flavin-dependent oxidoreductase [Chloroflexota bacterium]|nr:LLM class flavin-dependent oxidoreductase [Chloroflexota bacterium]
MVLLSVLDQSPIRRGMTPAEAIHETLRLAEAVDRLGYHRYWLAEHHSSGSLAGPSPEVMIGQVAARTARLRVGSGGVLLQHYSALKVAENFRVLETLFPGRIDLGIGRAPGSDPRTAQALVQGPGALGIEYFPHRVADLLRFLHDDLEPDHPFHGVHAMPTGPTAPEVWLLGSSAESASYAAALGTAFSFAHFINWEGGAQVTRAYQRAFRPSRYLAAPRASVAVFCVCAETEQQAERLAQSRLMWSLRLSFRETRAYPSVADAEAYPYTADERARMAYARKGLVVGAPEQVREQLLALAAEYAVDELILLTITEDFPTRLRSYELVAQAFGLA